MRFEGQVAVITGGSRGIGFAIAQRIVEENGRVCITGRKPEALAEAVDLLGGPAVAMGVAGSADDDDHQDDVIRRVLEVFGSLNVLVNNAGINPAYGSIFNVPRAAMDDIVNVNVIAMLSWTKKACAAYLAEAGGAVVNISSIAGLRPAAGIGFYGASKAAGLLMTQQLAIELAPKVRVNSVAPAVVETRFAAPLFKGRSEEVAATYPMKRLGQPNEVAGAVAYLASSDAAWVTGQTITVDGGLLLTGGA